MARKKETIEIKNKETHPIDYSIDILKDLDMLKRLCKYLEKGLSLDKACGMLYIDTDYINSCMELGKDAVKNRETNDYSRLYLNITRAISKPQETSLEKILASDSWKAHAWFLEKRYPKEFGGAQSDTNMPTINISMDIPKLDDKEKEEE